MKWYSFRRIAPLPVLLLLLVAIQPAAFYSPAPQAAAQPTPSRVSWWEFQSIDTMKYSRDLSRDKMDDPSFDDVIDRQIKDIADAGATTMSIATPYDNEFLPYLYRWVDTARRYGLKVWFRGNWSGWERWFDYPRITREQHLRKTANLIYTHEDLFEDGDIFVACPECENGGPGDPRLTGDVAGHRKFLIDEYQATREAFRRIDKNVKANFTMMNADVARLIMDREMTRQLGGLVVIDHYVASPQKLAADAQQIARQSDARIVIGELGVPIPDIHGRMTDEEQARWIDTALGLLADIPEVAGVNYWTNIGGSTEIWDAPGVPRAAVQVLHHYYDPPVLQGTVRDARGRPIRDALVATSRKQARTDANGAFALPYTRQAGTVTVRAEAYDDQTAQLADVTAGELEVRLQPQDKSRLASVRASVEDMLTGLMEWIKERLSALLGSGAGMPS